tara:strand:+ start:208 stop:375 length:168 start_codon:yes stop_codon:yes gene_type:complete
MQPLSSTARQKGDIIRIKMLVLDCFRDEITSFISSLFSQVMEARRNVARRKLIYQ